jgi:hypothetical protein
MCFWIYKWFRAGGRADVADVSRTFQALVLRGVAPGGGHAGRLTN